MFRIKKFGQNRFNIVFFLMACTCKILVKEKIYKICRNKTTMCVHLNKILNIWNMFSIEIDISAYFSYSHYNIYICIV